MTFDNKETIVLPANVHIQEKLEAQFGREGELIVKTKSQALRSLPQQSLNKFKNPIIPDERLGMTDTKITLGLNYNLSVLECQSINHEKYLIMDGELSKVRDIFGPLHQGAELLLPH